MLKNNNITLSGTAGAATAHISDSGDHVTYNVAVSGMTSSAGTVIASIPANAAQDSAGVWNDAKQNAINTASSQTVKEVWVAAGTYNEIITLPKSIALRGGFAVGAASKLNRDFDANKSTLSPPTGNTTDNIITNTDADSYNAIDGFTITGTTGCGIRCSSAVSPTIYNCHITNNKYGVYFSGTSSWIYDCYIENNRTGIESDSSMAKIETCHIDSNTQNGIYCNDSTITINRDWIEYNNLTTSTAKDSWL